MSEPSWSVLKPLRPDDKPVLVLQGLNPQEDRETADQEEEEFDEEIDDLVCDDPPTWRLPSDQRITFKTIAGSIFILVFFMALILGFSAPSNFLFIGKNDRERDGLKGPVKTVIFSRASTDPLFTQWADVTLNFTFDYDQDGNRIQETYFNGDNSISHKVVFTYDTTGKLIKAVVLDGGVKPTDEIAEKQNSLFNPLNTATLLKDKDVYQAYFDEKSDSFGNWTTREYFTRRNSRLYDTKPIGVEYRNISYFNSVSNPAPNPTPLFPSIKDDSGVQKKGPQ